MGATENVEWHQILGRKKASSSLPKLPPATASTTIAAGLELTPLWPNPEEDVSKFPMSEDLAEERSPTAPTDLPVPVMEASTEDAGIEAKEQSKQ